MKKYVGCCADINSSLDSLVARRFANSAQLSQFLALCYKVDIELAIFHVDWNHPDVNNIKKDLDEREHNFIAGIEDNYETGLMYLYDEFKDRHYFFL